MSPAPAGRHYLLVFVLSLSLLMLEILFARILSVALASHYAFVAISLAMFGISFSGLTVYLRPRHFGVERLDRRLVDYTWRFGLSTVASLALFLHLHVAQELSWEGILTLTLAYAILAVPFFYGGIGIALVMTHGAARMGRVYCADLIGASLGCVAVVVATNRLPAPLVVVLVGFLLTVVGVVLGARSEPRRVLAPGVALAIVVAMVVVGGRTHLFTMRYVKNWTDFYSDTELWNAFSRVSAFTSTGSNAAQYVPLKKPYPNYAGGGYPPTMMIDIDGTAWTPMAKFDGDLSAFAFLRESILYVAHHLRSQADVLVIGAGGGRDLLAAKVFGQRSVLGIEINPLIRQLVQERYASYSGQPYSLPGVAVVVDEARSQLTTLDRRFDVVMLSLIDTFSLNAAGGVVFSENYLYTQEAFQEYFRHLSDDGIFSVSRYYVPSYTLELQRLAGMARAAWAAEGVPHPADHIVVLGQGFHFTVLAKRTPWTTAELEQIGALVQQNNMVVLYQPGMTTGPMPELITLLTTPEFSAHVNSHPFHIEPATDDHPFFFHLLRGRLAAADIPPPTADPLQFLRMWHNSIVLMYMLIAIVAALAALFFIGPLLLRSRRPGSFAGVTVPLLLYFACLGYGFLMIEIPLLQRLVLFLGYPVYALTVVLFALLLFSGIGSFSTSYFTGEPQRVLAIVLVAIIGVASIYVYAIPVVVQTLLGRSLPVRIATAIALLAPLGTLLGMAYPLGIRILCRVSEDLVPWAWALNGAFSVVASVFAVFLGSRVGFSAAFVTGVVAYGTALIAILAATRWLPSRAAAPAEPAALRAHAG